jgi:hypothetical protein
MPMSMSKKNFTIWIVIFVVTFLSVTVGRRLIGFEVSSSLELLILVGVPIGSFLMLKKK